MTEPTAHMPPIAPNTPPSSYYQIYPPHPPQYYGPPMPVMQPAAVAQPTTRAPRWRRWAAGVAAAVVLAAGSGATGAVVVHGLDTGNHSTSTTANRQFNSLSDVVDAVSPSVVTVVVQGTESALGSGVILSSNGLIVTNQHVVSGGGQITVQLSNGKTLQTTLVGSDSTADLALLQATGASGLTAAVLGTSSSVTVGETVLAFGSPLGLEGTVTEGIVSAVNRAVDSKSSQTYLQTDAPINSGNSGGALVNAAGQVIGINVAIATSGQSTGSIGIGFAIPSDTVRTVVQKLSSGSLQLTSTN